MKAFALLLSTVALSAQNGWETPFPPHKVIGNVYYIGTKGLASYLITTRAGHILINSDFERTVPQLRENVEKLGFKFTDIKIILGSHAHSDHMEGDALLKELTGAKVMAMAEDVPELKTIVVKGKPHPIDHELKDNEEVKLGGTTLTALRTPGHTKGCTTWTLKAAEEGKTYNVAIVCSLGVNDDYMLLNNFHYPNIAGDYEYSFRKLSTLPVDVFLGAHGAFYQMEEKYAKLGKGGPNPFINPDDFVHYVDAMRVRFHTKIMEQRERFK
jgi:metallo-beta-lactamase class B